MQMRQWLIGHFSSDVGADLASGSDHFEHCCRCGQTYYARDLQQVLPHFEHQLGLGAEGINGPVSNEDV